MSRLIIQPSLGVLANELRGGWASPNAANPSNLIRVMPAEGLSVPLAFTPHIAVVPTAAACARLPSQAKERP
jgi:hypothetical protein